MANIYSVMSGAAPTTAPLAVIATGASTKTLIQLSTPSTQAITIVQWSVSFDSAGAETPAKIELMRSNVAATVTAYATADITKWGRPGDAANSALTLGTSASGFNASAEGSTTTGIVYETHFWPTTSGPFLIQYPLGREPFVPVSAFLRLRVTLGVGRNAFASIIWEE